MEVTSVNSKVKIWKSQVQDHEMIESDGKGEHCDHHVSHKSINTIKSTSMSTLCGPSNLNTLLL